MAVTVNMKSSRNQGERLIAYDADIREKLKREEWFCRNSQLVIGF